MPETVTPAVPTVAPSVQALTKPQAIVPPAALGRVRAPPAARRFASAHGIDLSAIVGSGPFGAIVLDDVERATGTAVTPHIERKRAAGLDDARCHRGRHGTIEALPQSKAC